MRARTKTNPGSLYARMSLRVLVTLFALSLPIRAFAQEGWNATVYSGNSYAPSYAFVDGFAYEGDSTKCNGACDICKIIYYALQDNHNTNGVVIDTRGVSQLTCSGSDGVAQNPWSALTASLSNIVLLPAGTITLSSTWILPDHTHLIGEGPSVTTVKASSSFGSPDMIDMGVETQSSSNPCYNNSSMSPAWDCPGVAIEHLGLDGNGNASVSGIVNCCSQEFSRVNDVSISNVAMGLTLTDKFAENSGPYSNITMSNIAGQCVNFHAPSPNTIPNTRGIHGLSCSLSSISPGPAIEIETHNNTLEDISIEGSSSQDGILIGSTAAAQGNMLFNVTGIGLRSVVRLCKNCSGANSTDVTMLGINCFASGSTCPPGTFSIEDDLESTSLTDSVVGLYVSGEPVLANGGGVGYSRFTTSPSVPTWLVGNGPSGTCALGTLYSCTNSSSTCTYNGTSGTLWECVVNGSTPWKKVF